MIYGDESNYAREIIVFLPCSYIKASAIDITVIDVNNKRILNEQDEEKDRLDSYSRRLPHDSRIPSLESIIQSSNLYAYGCGNPVFLIDTNGENVGVGAAVGSLGGPVGTIIGAAIGAVVGTAVICVVGEGISKFIDYASEHTKLNGSKKRTNDKHTKPRSGRESEKKKQSSKWKSRH